MQNYKNSLHSLNICFTILDGLQEKEGASNTLRAKEIRELTG